LAVVERRVGGPACSCHGAGLLAYAPATRDCRSVNDPDAAVFHVSGASGILSAEVAVNVPLGAGWYLSDFAEVGEALGWERVCHRDGR